ncbi:hypothetical protein V6N12_068154 [Hibiscus sabdariffa]|uniref:Uncharacterized protein n=1 Tax=Hibiscus sabdariffa TaxID=183260 RepID=A0ABR2FP53_9ROSI
MGATSLLGDCSVMNGEGGGCSVLKRWPNGCVHKGGDGSATWCLPPCQFPPKVLPPLACSLHRCFAAKLYSKGGRPWC